MYTVPPIILENIKLYVEEKVYCDIHLDYIDTHVTLRPSSRINSPIYNTQIPSSPQKAISTEAQKKEQVKS